MFEHLTPKAKEAAERLQWVADDHAYDRADVCNVVSDLLAALAETPWQSIESAPKDGTQILVAATYADVPMMRDACFDDEDGGWWCQTSSVGQERVPFEPTHWMPLAPPEEAKL